MGVYASAQKVETDYFQALELAKAQQKSILYVFVKEGLPKDFKNNFFKAPALKELATKFIILEVNCTDNQDTNTLMYCRRLTMVHNKEEVFPAVMATNKKFQEVGDLQSDFSKQSMDAYFNFLKSL
jgi:hypothetical protein